MPAYFTRYHKGTLLATALIFILLSCAKTYEKPDKGSEAYQKVVSDFYVSLAAIQADQALFAVEKMQSVADQYPPEAAAWANLGVFAMRQGNFELAEKQIGKAMEKSERNAEIIFLAGILESRRGNVDESVAYLREAAKINPADIKIAYALAEELERQDTGKTSEEVFPILQSIIEQQPDNLAVLLEMVRTSLKWENRATLEQAMDALSEKAAEWPEEITRQFQEIRQTILESSDDNLTFQLAFLRNNLNQLPEFQSDLAAVQIPPTQVGFLITEFTWLPKPATAVAEPDNQLTFQTQIVTDHSDNSVARTIALSDDQDIDRAIIRRGILTINNDQELVFPGEANSRYAVETLDYDYDFLNDLALAGNSGFKLYRQQEDSSFVDVTPTLNLPASVLRESYYGTWSRDLDLDGDLDIVLSPQNGSAVVLRNNGDGSFTNTDWFNNIETPVNFEWADFDGDTDSDAAFINKEGDVTLVLNERSSNFKVAGNLPQSSGAIDIEVADIDNDANFDLLIWNHTGIYQIYFDQKTASWKENRLATIPDEIGDLQASPAHLYSVDLDNNGGNDLVISSSQRSGYWLNNERLKFVSEMKDLPGNIQDIADLNGDTRLDIIGIDSEGNVQEGINSGSKNYIARIIRPRASGLLGDQRINSFGIGGEVEIRSGLLYEKQLIKQPWVHLGLGTYEEAELLRIIWPNGSSQAEFAELGYGSKIFNEQILKGSCPWVFAYNGNQMEFVTDFLWRTGLGIRINAQGEADVIHSIDWIKIGGDQLKPRNGQYDIRITADLWETHFFDYVSLMAVDHPVGTEVFVDERFTFPPRAPKLYALKQLQPVVKAFDQDGKDVTEKIRHNDREFVDSFKLTKYQGLAQEHYLEIDLGENIPENEKVRLVAKGWIYPTDTSINIAISQGSQDAPHPIRLEVPDGKGGWKVAKKNVGFPAGKSKTMLIDVTDIFEPGTGHRVRLVTNMEIYWNQIQWAVEQPDAKLEKKELEFTETGLRYRGFSEVKRPTRFVPERPNYQQISGTTPMWSDLVGFYTRFGEVDELVEKTDDRYVIMNAGDELVFKFPALSPPEKGWTRDFVLVGDGWVKDGDFNTGFSKTVIPLPYHGMKDYAEAPGLLQEDPVFQKHKKDWVNYHTRYITPKGFHSALKFED